MQFFVLLAGVITVVTCQQQITSIGPCTVNVEEDEDFDFNQFATENGGIWSYKLVPNVNAFINLKWMFIDLQPIASTGVFQATIYEELEQQEPSVFARDIEVNVHTGIVTVKPIYANTTSDEYKIYFLAYEPGKFAYYYICSENGGGDPSTDYRYVLSHTKLTSDVKEKIKKIEEDFQFKGNLRYVLGNE